MGLLIDSGLTAVQLSVTVDFVEEIDLNETLVSKLSLVVINTQSSELLRISEAVFALSSVLNKFVR